MENVSVKLPIEFPGLQIDEHGVWHSIGELTPSFSYTETYIDGKLVESPIKRRRINLIEFLLNGPIR